MSRTDVILGLARGLKYEFWNWPTRTASSPPPTLDRNEKVAGAPRYYGWQEEPSTRLVQRMSAAHRWRNLGRVWVNNRCTATNPRMPAGHNCHSDGYAWIVSIDG